MPTADACRLRGPARPGGLGKVEVEASVSEPPQPPRPARPVHLPGRGPCEGSMRYTRFEKARIIGARALQISMGAPILIDIPPGVIDPIEIATHEFATEAIPLTVTR